MTQKKLELLKNPTKIEEIQEKKIIDRNWTITTGLLRDSNPDYQRLKIMSRRWRPPPRMHSFTATTHFKSSRSFVSPCVFVLHALQNATESHSAEHSSVFVGIFKSSRFFCVTLYDNRCWSQKMGGQLQTIDVLLAFFVIWKQFGVSVLASTIKCLYPILNRCEIYVWCIS